MRLRLLTACLALATAPAAYAQEAVPQTAPAAAPQTAPVPAEDAAVVEPEAPEPPIPAVWSPVPRDAEGRPAYGYYLSGRLAGIRGDREASAELLTRAHDLAPEQPRVADEAFRAVLFAGDISEAARLTRQVSGTPMLADAGRLFEVVAALESRKGRQAREALRRAPFSEPYDHLAGYLAPVVAAAAGDWNSALAPIDASITGPTRLVALGQRAQLLDLRRRRDEADAEYKALMALPSGPRLYGVLYGQFLERQGRREEALQAYGSALRGGVPDPRVLTQLTRLQAGGRPPATPGLSAIAADALDFGALEMSEMGSQELAAIYLRLSLALQPDDGRALRLAQSLAAADQKALAADWFERVGPGNPIQYAAAQIGLASLREGQGDKAGALEALARADAAASDQPEVARRYALGLIGAQRYDEALGVLDRPALARVGAEPGMQFLRGLALQELGRIDEAESQYQAALAQQPDNPLLLNQLGYMWVDSGRKVEEGAALLARAHAAQPDDANIQDSLGWAKYRQGDFAAAVADLEAAVDKQPANAVILDHLGDAYWRVGRTREAEWQWRRALALDLDAELRQAVEVKLRDGLSSADRS